ncbi:B-box domain protein [Heracleum sosnowskyi]|uniref:B-box domain protein n=1 Tax=Heracleum sosnowskyi TaxID=360622 RepID=A0AAD8IXY8_9APIA|nr:B-box domain protein [Heracleum sosnowskyi]
MTKCELCKSTARVYCKSDEARLCWSCDAKVHSANFLVARHVRNLLCHSCQSPTAWNGSGEKLGRTISLCEPCVVRNCVKFTEKVESEGAREGSSESGTDFDSEDEDLNLIEDNYNQVAPLSSFTSPSSQPVVSSSGTEHRADIDINLPIKRSYEFEADLKSKDDGDSSCIAGEENSYKISTLRPFKFRKLEVKQTSRPQGMAEPISGVEACECVDFDLNECPFDQQK